MQEYFKYVRSLKFNETPKYKYLRELFEKILKGNGCYDLKNIFFSWVDKSKWSTIKKRSKRKSPKFRLFSKIIQQIENDKDIGDNLRKERNLNINSIINTTSSQFRLDEQNNNSININNNTIIGGEKIKAIIKKNNNIKNKARTSKKTITKKMTNIKINKMKQYDIKKSDNNNVKGKKDFFASLNENSLKCTLNDNIIYKHFQTESGNLSNTKNSNLNDKKERYDILTPKYLPKSLNTNKVNKNNNTYNDNDMTFPNLQLNKINLKAINYNNKYDIKNPINSFKELIPKNSTNHNVKKNNIRINKVNQKTSKNLKNYINNSDINYTYKKFSLNNI
jgi:hypothetical protein